MVQILSRKKLFQSKFFEVNQMVIKRSGKTYTKDYIKRAEIVNIVAVTPSLEVYLVSEYRDIFDQVMLEVPGGKIEDDLSPLDNAMRELKEETGLEASDWKQIATWDMSHNMISKVYVFLARGLTEGKQDLDEDEELSVVKMPLNEALRKIENGEINVGDDVASLLLVSRILKKEKTDI